MNGLDGRINDRPKKALLRVFKGGLSAKNYITITGTTTTTASRNLVDKGALRKTGELKHARYYLNI